MSIGPWLLLAVLCDVYFKDVSGSRLLCNRTKITVGEGDSRAAVVVRLSGGALGPCRLRLVAPNAASFVLRLVEANEKIDALEMQRRSKTVSSKKQELDSSSAIAQKNTDSCQLLVYEAEQKRPSWQLRLCGGEGSTTPEGAGLRFFTTNITVEWRPPTPLSKGVEVNLIATALYSGEICKNESQFKCGSENLCIPSYLTCDKVKHCPGGDEEDPEFCRHQKEYLVLKVAKIASANLEETFNFDYHETSKLSNVIMRINETEQKPNPLADFAESLRPYSPWSYLVLGMLVCATILMFCLAWECCCKSFKPSDTPLHMPPSCMDLSATVAMTAASQQLFASSVSSTPPAYDPPPTYSSLFPRAFKSSPTPVPHCSHQEPPD